MLCQCGGQAVADKQAQAIALEYPSMGDLMRAYQQSNPAASEKLLEGLLLPGSTRKVGPVASSRVYRYLMADDPAAVVPS
mmetsp:Transcript_54439/g.172994  ORF Transcript_54439/g.172994 Transcript_54439/m.172994 type:complete len:80 (+) Transcript_54439:1711-1950(+)